MQVELVEITPLEASELLANSHTTQRPLSKRRVASLAAAIERGEWKVTHQPIALDTAMNVIDGQHRLAAIVKSGIAVKLLVASDADPATFGVVDTGAPRSLAAILTIDGMPQAAHVSTLARAYMMYRADLESGTPWSTTINNLPAQRVLNMLDAGKAELLHTALLRAKSVIDAIGRFGYRTGLGVFIAVAMEETHHPDSLTDFLEHLRGGHMLSETSPILALQRWVHNPRTGMSTLTGRERTRAAIINTTKAFNDYVDGLDAPRFYKYHPDTVAIAPR